MVYAILIYLKIYSVEKKLFSYRLTASLEFDFLRSNEREEQEEGTNVMHGEHFWDSRATGVQFGVWFFLSMTISIYLSQLVQSCVKVSLKLPNLGARSLGHGSFCQKTCMTTQPVAELVKPISEDALQFF